MNSLRRWLYRPKKSDSSLLAQFYFNDEELNAVAAELDSFDGRKDPERCAELVNKLRSCQDCVLTTIQHIMVEAIPDRRTSRDFRVKFPDDVVQENLAGQLWFGAECLAAGSSIMNREEESTSMRPLARALTKNLDSLRCILREQCIRSLSEYSERIKEALVIFDKLFAEFELSYVSAMVPVKTRKEYEMIQEITVLFSETVQRAMKQGHLSQDTIDEYDPALMFTIPRLAIICGLLVYPEGPLNPDNPPAGMSDMFRPFQPLLIKIRELLSTLTCQELYSLEHALCTSEGPPLMTVLESQVSSSDNACQTDFDPSSPTKARLGASLLYPTPLSPGAPQGAECSSLNAAGTPGSECSGKSEMGDLEPENEAYSLIGSYREKESTNGVKIMGAGGEREGEEREKEMREEAKKEEEERATRNEAEEEKELETKDICDVEYGELTTCALNKSESNDSGLHSENTSNLCTVSFSDSQQTLSLTDSAAPSPLESPTDAMGSGDPAGCLEQSSAPGKIERGSPAKRSVLQESGSRNAACDCRSDSGGSGSDSGFCSNDYCMFHVDDAEADGARPQGLGKRPDVLELPNSPMGDADECVFDSDEPGNGRPSPSHPCLRSPSPTRDSSSLSVQSALHSLDHPCASPQNLLSKSSETGEVGVEAPEEVCVSTDAVWDADTSNNTCAKPKSVEVAPPTPDDHNESDGNDESDDEEATSSSDETNEEDEGNGKEDTGGDDMKEENGGSNAEQMEVPSTAVAELSLDGLSVGDLTTMENLIAGTVDLNCNRNGNRSSLPAPPPSIQAQVGGAAPLGEGECLRLPRVQRLRYADSCTSFCSSSGSVHSSPVRDNQWEKESACSIASSETSSYNSECHDEEEIAMAIQAAEVASRNEARMRFRSSSDMIHRLFVVISGVADQLQTNFASDLRHILRAVFDMNCSEPLVSSDGKESGILSPEIPHRRRPRPQNPRPQQLGRAAPEWMPDELCSTCLACSMPFTLIRRRHHCRNCGRIYCGRCSSNVVPLPHYGHHKPVRVCNRCFMFQVTAFTMTSHS